MADPRPLEPEQYVVSVTKLGLGGEWVLRKRVEDGWTICSRDEPSDAAAFALADGDDWFGLSTGDYPLTVPVPNGPNEGGSTS